MTTNDAATKLPFTVDAALLFELGERLVARRSVAVAELIKNAYDADATRVTVSFENVTSRDGQIVITDDGSGISLDAMRDTWMRIATTDAVVNSRSKRFGRPRTGAKGVGRFACRRLGSQLLIESVSRTSTTAERIRATFNWHDFTMGLDLDDILTEILHEPMDVSSVTIGTTLTLRHLADRWTATDLSSLLQELDVLMHPGMHGGSIVRSPDYDPDPGFTIDIKVPEFPAYEGTIDDRFLSAAWGTLTGTVSDNGIPSYTLTVHRNEQTHSFQPPRGMYKNLDEAAFTIHMMIYLGSNFKSTGYTVARARAIGRQGGGVRVYLDGFQVFSYGAPGDDWLDLDKDRARRLVSVPTHLREQAKGLGRPMLLLPGNMQLFGSVAISRDRNPGLAVSISRERLVHNDGFDELRKFVRDGINWMTVCYAREQAKERANAQPTRSKPRVPVAHKEPRNPLIEARTLIRQNASIPKLIKQEIDASLGELERQQTAERAATLSELSMLRVLASAGTTVLVFDHTLRAMAGQLLDVVERLGVEVGHLPANRRATAKQIMDDLNSWTSMATGQGRLVGLLVGSEARTRRTSLAVRPLVDSLSRGFAGYMDRFGISLENAVPAAVRTPPLHEAELYAVLLNLITNSFKAVRGRAHRRVCVDAEMTRRQFTLRIHDTGIGISAEHRTEVFEAFYTTSQPDPVLGIGTGLGLKIVRDIVYAWGGHTHFLDPKTPWSTSVEVSLPFKGFV